MKKLISTVLLLSVLLGILSGCSGNGGGSDGVLVLGRTTITEGMYSYYLSTYKARYIKSYGDMSDTEEFWNAEALDGKTNAEVLGEIIYNSIAENVAACEEFRRLGLSLTDAQKKTVDDYLDGMVEELASGSRQKMNEHLAPFGIDLSTLREILLMEKEMEVLYDYLYGKNGTDPVDETDRDKYYRENYVRFQQIYINDVSVIETDKDGKYLTDEEGKYKTRPLTDEEKKAAEEKVAAVKAGLEAGEDFDSLKEKYSDSKDYPRGYYFSPVTSTDYITAIVSKAISMRDDHGEWVYVEEAADKGEFFIKILPLEDAAYADAELSDFFDGYDSIVAEDLFSARMETVASDIVKDEEFFDGVSVAKAVANYYYY